MIQIEVNDRLVLDALQQMMRRMGDMTPAMRDIAGVLADASERAFQNEQDPTIGQGWAALRPATVAFRGGAAHPILQRSGQLAASISSSYGANFAQVGTNKVYAAMMQFGGTTASNSMMPNKEIAARPFIGLGDQDQVEILDTIQEC